MPSLKEVKGRIKSVQSTQQITKAMKMVAAAKLRRAQDKIVQLRPYASKLEDMMGNLSRESAESFSSPYFENREVNRVLLIPISSDKGLCGAFNSNVFKSTVSFIEENYKLLHKKGLVEIMPIGKRSQDYFKRRKYPLVDTYADLFSEISFEKISQGGEFVMREFRKGYYDQVFLFYNEFKNVATQIMRTEQFLPIVPSHDEIHELSGYDYIYEPNREYIIEELIPKSLRINFFKAVLESNASEHGARMTAMDKATENASELLKELRLTYNRTRQAAITKEILEIVAGAEALSGK
jgi:F-type H+-transporting ATPase subunit gamma